jgi:hypothetical protein
MRFDTAIAPEGDRAHRCSESMTGAGLGKRIQPLKRPPNE